jgi:hypothetical protein
MEIWDIFNVEDTTVGIEPVWYIDQIRRSDGLVIRGVYPKSIIEWRAAEYGIDCTTPEGRQDILDIVLHEHHLEPIDMVTMDRNLRGVRRKGDPVHLYNAPTQAEALIAYRLRVDEAKTRVTVNWPKGETKKGITQPHALQGVVLDHQPSQAGVEAKLAHVRDNRRGLGLEPITRKVESTPAAYDPAVRRRGLTVAIMDASTGMGQ